MHPTKVAVLSRQGRASLDEAHALWLEQHTDVGFFASTAAPPPAQATAILADVDVLAATNLCLPTLDSDLLDAAPRLRHIALHATGYDHIDVGALAERGVSLGVLPEYATTAVAEHCIGLLLSSTTRIHLAHARGQGLVPRDVSLRGIEVHGKTLGIVGLGRIGTVVASLAAGIGMKVIATDIDPTAVAHGTAAGTAMTDLDGLLRASDAVAVCASHCFGAPPILGPEQLSLLSPDAMLVNVSRSALVDTAAVVESIRSGALRSYAVDDDVVDHGLDSDLLREGRILQSGHSAWWADEVLERGRQMWGERIIAAVKGRPIDVVSPFGAPAT